MLTLTIALFAAAGAFVLCRFPADLGTGWSVFLSLLALVGVQGGVGFWLQRRVKRDMEAVQQILLAGQQRLQAKMSRWQFRPPGSVQAAQKEVQDDTRVFVKEAIARAEELAKYRLWVPMMARQLATAKVQLYWMIRDFRQVDALMPKALLIDPTLAAMKMARMHMLKADAKDIRKVYEKAARRARYNGNVLVAATMSWIQVQAGDVDGAFRTLTQALKKSDDATLRRNHELLMNNRVAHFSNSGLGDPWYSLMLEEPKAHAQRQRSVYR